jgi:hypothetical protein
MKRLFILGLFLPACIGAQGRVHVGPTVDSSGEVGVHAGATFGFGYATSDRGGVLIGAGEVSGSETHVGIASVIEGAKLGEDHGDLGYRAGVRADMGLVGERSFLAATGAVLYPLRERSSSGGHEKSFQEETRTALAVGFEGQVGAVMLDVGDQEDAELRLGAGAALTLEWLMFSRMH